MAPHKLTQSPPQTVMAPPRPRPSLPQTATALPRLHLPPPQTAMALPRLTQSLLAPAPAPCLAAPCPLQE